MMKKLLLSIAVLATISTPSFAEVRTPDCKDDLGGSQEKGCELGAGFMRIYSDTEKSFTKCENIHNPDGIDDTYKSAFTNLKVQKIGDDGDLGKVFNSYAELRKNSNKIIVGCKVGVIRQNDLNNNDG